MSGGRGMPSRLSPAERQLLLPVAAVLAATVALSAAASPWLPDPVASHFTHQVPDSATRIGPMVAVVVLTGLVPTLAWGAIARIVALPAAVHALAFIALFTYTMVCLAGLAFGVLAANLGATSWVAARSPGWSQPVLIGVIVASLLGSLLHASLFLRRNSRTTTRAPSSGAPIDLDDVPGHAVWVGHARNPALSLTAAATSLTCLLAGLWMLNVTVIVIGAIVGLAATTMRAEAIFDGRSLRARGSALLPWRRIPLESIESAELVHVSPSRWLGYGIRWRGNEQAFVVRSGSGLRVRVHARPGLVVSVDDAATGAQLIERRRRALGATDEGHASTQ